jgi:hypothetical protein
VRPKEPRRTGAVGRAASVVATSVVLVLLGVGVALSATRLVDVDVDLPAYVPLAGAALVSTVLCGLLAHRIGAQTMAATAFGAVSSTLAVASGWTWLLAGMAALTAFTATVLGVVATRPAKAPRQVIVEYALAVGVALLGAVAVAAYAAPLRPVMLANVVLLSSLIATLWVAHRLGGGLQGLGSRGAVVILSAVAVLVVGLAYSEALRRWGTPGLITAVETFHQTVANLFGGVPRPLEIFIGFPALVWGLATRAKLRQGWWVCAFGCLGTSGVATSLAAPDAVLGQELLSTLYSMLVGLVLGFAIWRVDRLFTGPRGRRARGAERALPLRPEPSRSRPLL